eukprot:Nk52_evm38s1992 gene=Nk52_evmTU38s1992
MSSRGSSSREKGKRKRKLTKEVEASEGEVVDLVEEEIRASSSKKAKSNLKEGYSVPAKGSDNREINESMLSKGAEKADRKGKSVQKGGSNSDNVLVKEFLSMIQMPSDASSIEYAQNLLAAAANDVNTALELHWGSQGQEPKSSAMAGEEEVRAPIPQTRGVLIDQIPDTGDYEDRRNRSRPRASHRATAFEAFRNFEEELAQGTNDRERRTLANLFKPPLDLYFHGTFDQAKESGEENNKWLLVNIQEPTQFLCQVMNRDVWSNEVVRGMIKENFLFMQIYSTSEEGERYCQYYPCNGFPHVAIIDPRTGERMTNWGVEQLTDPHSLAELITGFLSSHSLTGNCTVDEMDAKRRKIMDEDEEAQIALAIAASLGEQEKPKPKKSRVVMIYSSDEDGSICEEIEDEDEDDVKTESENSELVNISSSSSDSKTESSSPAQNPTEEEEEQLEEEPGKSVQRELTTRIQFRMEDGSRKVRSFLKSAMVKQLFLFVKSVSPDPSAAFELMKHDRSLLKENEKISLEEAGVLSSVITVVI